MLIKNIIGQKTEDEFITVRGEETLVEIARKMLGAPHRDLEDESGMNTMILAAYVMEGNKPIGVIDRDDLLLASIIQRKDPERTTAKDVMDKPVCISVNSDVQDVVNLILDKGLISVAVVDGDDLKGVLTVYDAIYLEEATADEFFK
nr:CBS domain-containing protein [Candidatus Sigynarchaeota archaeon]